MTLAVIIAIIVLGLIFVLVEIFLLPGAGFVGVLGGVMVAGGILLAYAEKGVTFGNYTLVISLSVFTVLVITGLKRVAKLKWSLKENIGSRVNVVQQGVVKPGDEGIAFTDLRPNGKAVINNLRLEVFSIGEFISKNVPVQVTKVLPDKIYVKPKTEAK